MFEIFLGRKFSSRCKHSVKCIRCRMEMIRKKKHAMVRYLKKDVADLVSGGHDANAFGRMDALIVEINQSSCYDMIEQYCSCILEHLPTMQKERICPGETVEAVATLIFAAARFSDLPELADLRSWFTDRYRTHMEAYINGEFVEKMQKKSFPEDKKLQLMQDIAQEFSVKWDVKAFKFKESNQSAATSDQTNETFFPSSNENNKQYYMLGGRREVVDGRNEYVDGGKSVLNKSGSLGSAYQVSDIEKQKTKFEEQTNVEVIKEDQNVIRTVRNEQLLGIAMQKQQIKPVERMYFHTPSNSANGYTPDSTDTENVEPRYFDKRVAHVRSKSNLNGNHTKELIGKGNSHKISASVNEGLGSIGTEREGAAAMLSKDAKTINMTPPYTKHASTCLDGFSLNTSADFFKEMDLNGQESQIKRTIIPENNRAFNLKPPYVKPNIKKSSLETNNVNPINNEISSCGDFGGHLKNVSFSVRRVYLEQATSSNADSIDEDGVSTKNIMHDNQKSFISGQSNQTENDAMYYGRRRSRTFSDQPRHGNRHGTTTTYDGECNQEEDIMYKLLLRYSKTKDRTRMKETSKQPILDPARISENPFQDKHPNISLHTPTRIASMPSEPTCPPATIVRSHMRAASMQPELLIPSDGRVHPRLPDYDDLAARIAELRKS